MLCVPCRRFIGEAPHINFPKRRKSESYTNENTQSKAPGAGIEPTKHIAAFAQAFYIAFPIKLSRRIPTQSIVQVHHVSIDRVVIHRHLKLASTQHAQKNRLFLYWFNWWPWHMIFSSFGTWVSADRRIWTSKPLNTVNGLASRANTRLWTYVGTSIYKDSD